MNARAFVFALAVALAGGASAQQQPLVTAPLRPGALAGNARVLAATANTECANVGAIVHFEATVRLPESAGDEIAFDLVEGARVQASGTAPVMRILTPEGERVGAPTAIIASDFNVSGYDGEGALRLRVRIGAAADSAPVSYRWSCATLAPIAPGRIALPDLAFSQDYLTIGIIPYDVTEGGRRNRGNSDFASLFTLPEPHYALFWDQHVCTSRNMWIATTIRPIIVNLGAEGSAPARFKVETQVVDAPVINAETDVALRGIWHSLVRNTNAARQTTGNQDTVGFADLSSEHHLNLARYTVSGRLNNRAMRATNGIEVGLPCGAHQVMWLILDPNNEIRESNETNNRMLINFSVIG